MAPEKPMRIYIILNEKLKTLGKVLQMYSGLIYIFMKRNIVFELNTRNIFRK